MLEVIEQLAAAARHLQQAPAGMKVLPVGAQVLGGVVDARGEKSDLNLARTCVLLVDFVLCDDFWLNDCGHWYIVELHDCRGPLQAPCRPPKRGLPRPSRRHRSNLAECQVSHGGPPNLRKPTDARE